MEARTDPQQDLCGIDGAGIFAGRYFGEGWYGPSPFFATSGFRCSSQKKTGSWEDPFMKVKKAGKRVFGAVMSAAEKKAMDMEIQRQLAEYDRKHIREIDALVLWELREQLGFGNKRLKKFYDNFSRGIEALIRRYEMEQGDDVWLCTYKLKEIGCDLEKWEKERGDQ